MKFQLTIIDSPSCITNIGGLRSLHGIKCPMCSHTGGAFIGWVGKKLGFHFRCLNCGAEFITLSQTLFIEPWEQNFCMDDFDTQARAEMRKHFLPKQEEKRRELGCQQKLPPDYQRPQGHQHQIDRELLSPVLHQRTFEVLEGGKGRGRQEEDLVSPESRGRVEGFPKNPLEVWQYTSVPKEVTTEPQPGSTQNSTKSTGSERTSLLTQLINSLQSILVKKDRR